MIDAKTGVILCDSVLLEKVIDNVLDRKEIHDAISSPERTGYSLRKSLGLGNKEGVYVARFFPELNVVVRIGQSHADLAATLQELRNSLILFSGVVGALILSLLILATRQVLAFKNKRDLEIAEYQVAEKFALNASHELRTPLTSIRGFISTVRSELAAGRAPNPEFFDVIDRESQRLLGLVNETLDYAAIQSGRMKLYPEVFVIHEVIHEVISSLKIDIEQKSIQVLLETGEVECFLDRDRMIQVVMNLLSNAIKHSPSGGVIRITAKETGSRIILEIQDQGPGIPEELNKSLFERFAGDFKAPSSSGLGLSITRGLVELHGGRIRASSGGKKGTVFRVDLPASFEIVEN